jgi:hypothetical protein
MVSRCVLGRRRLVLPPYAAMPHFDAILMIKSGALKRRIKALKAVSKQ